LKHQWFFEQFPEVKKFSVVMSRNKKLVQWMKNYIPNHTINANAVKDTIPSLLNQHAGGIVLLTSRYEGFSLSLIEAMSQGLVPISFSVGVAPEIIRNGENGFIVHTIEEAEEKIKLLLNDTVLEGRTPKKNVLSFLEKIGRAQIRKARNIFLWCPPRLCEAVAGLIHSFSFRSKKVRAKCIITAHKTALMLFLYFLN